MRPFRRLGHCRLAVQQVPNRRRAPAMTAVAEQTGSAIRPFQVSIPDEALTELRRRIQTTRWPSRELVPDRSQGVQLATIQELARYWATEYDWRRCEARLDRKSTRLNSSHANISYAVFCL